jgi:hypothetical protein
MPPIPEDGISSQGGRARCKSWKCNASLGWMPTECCTRIVAINGSVSESCDSAPAKSGGDTIRDKMSEADGAEQASQVASADPEPDSAVNQVASADPEGDCIGDSCDPPSGSDDGTIQTAQQESTCNDPNGCVGAVGTASLRIPLH